MPDPLRLVQVVPAEAEILDELGALHFDQVPGGEVRVRAHVGRAVRKVDGRPLHEDREFGAVEANTHGLQGRGTQRQRIAGRLLDERRDRMGRNSLHPGVTNELARIVASEQGEDGQVGIEDHPVPLRRHRDGGMLEQGAELGLARAERGFCADGGLRISADGFSLRGWLSSALDAETRMIVPPGSRRYRAEVLPASGADGSELTGPISR